MKLSTRVGAAVMLLNLSLPGFLAAEEVPRKHYSPPLGITQTDGLKIIFAVGAIRIQAKPNHFCTAAVTVEVQDAIDHTVLATFGPSSVSQARTFVVDFQARPGPPPARQEVVVVISVPRTPRRDIEFGALPDLCPFIGSIQSYDLLSGRTTVFIESSGWAQYECSPLDSG